MKSQWIKLSVDIFESRKIRMIESMPEGDTIFSIWIKLLTEAGKTNDRGYVYFAVDMPYTVDMLAVLFNKSDGIVKKALDVFSQFKMIDIDEDGFIYIIGWAEHQNVEGLEKIREQNRVRKQNQRAREKAAKAIENKDLCVSTDDGCNSSSNIDVTSRDMERNSHVTVTQCRTTDIEEDKDIDKKKVSKKKKSTAEKCKPFYPPTLPELEAYKHEEKLNVDCNAFIDHYLSNGWKVGQNLMNDWKAEMRKWSRYNKKGTLRSDTPNLFVNFDQRDDNLDMLVHERMLKRAI